QYACLSNAWSARHACHDAGWFRSSVTVYERCAVVVVGGGLAGMAATVEARRAGLETCLIEQRESVRGPRALLRQLEASGAQVCVQTTAWGLFGRQLALCGQADSSRVVIADQVILASGAYERPVAFPGWTLHGVMTAVCASRLFAQGVLL